MNNRLFKKAAKKSIFQGLSAWFLFQIFNLIEPGVALNEETEDLKLIMYYTAIPALATIGFEIATAKLLQVAPDMELGVNNFLGTMVMPFLLSEYVDFELGVPISLYALAALYYLSGNEQPRPEVVLIQEPQIVYRF